MGVGSSSELVPERKVFHQEFREINRMLSEVLNETGTFRENKYNMFVKGQCEAMTLVTEKRLKRHAKFELQGLKDKLYMIPNTEMVETKRDLCHAISMHYVRILRLLHTVRRIYDVESQGDYSIAGILLRNITVREGLVEARFCAGPQEELGTFDKGVDFSKLAGFRTFVDDMLSPQERSVFMGHLRELLNRADMRFIRKWIDRDLLVSKREYKRVYRGGDPKAVFVKVAAGNPILSWQLCANQKSHIAKVNPELLRAIKQFRDRYRANMREIQKSIGALLREDDASQLRDVNEAELDGIERELKRTLVLFFVESLVNYRHVLTVAQKYSVNRNE